MRVSGCSAPSTDSAGMARTGVRGDDSGLTYPACESANLEDRVHDLSPGADNWPQLTSVDRLRCGRDAVSNQPGDLLHWHALLAHDRDEGMPQLPRAPVLANPCGYANLPKGTPDMRRVERGADSRREH